MAAEYLPVSPLHSVEREQFDELQAHWTQHAQPEACADCARWVTVQGLLMVWFR